MKDFETMEVTPAMAEVWLGKNPKNRDLKPQRVIEYAEEMLKDNWHVGTESIKFDVDGNLLDGQHRLNAVIRSKKTVKLDIRGNLPSESQQYMDRPLKRNLAQDLKMDGVKYNTTISGMLTSLKQFRDTGAIGTSGKELNKAEAMEDWIDPFQIILKIAEEANRTASGAYKPLSPVQTGVLLFLFSLASDYEKGLKFLKLVQLGTVDEDSSPAKLRDRLLNEKSKRNRGMSIGDIYHLSIKAWNSWLRDESIKQLKLDSKFPAVLKEDGNLLSKQDFKSTKANTTTSRT